MSPSLTWLLVSWGSLTVLLILLLIYRSTLTMHEDDQLFLDDSQSQMAQDQMQVMQRVNRITPIVQVLGALCGVMLLVIAGIFVYQGLTQVQ
jgi:Tfp pilus assembly protein PilN